MVTKNFLHRKDFSFVLNPIPSQESSGPHVNVPRKEDDVGKSGDHIPKVSIRNEDMDSLQKQPRSQTFSCGLARAY